MCGEYEIKEEEVERRIRARETAEEIYSLVESEEEILGKHVWEVLYKKFQNRKMCETKTKEKSSRMTVAESRRFGKQPIPFGRFKGQPVDQVPLDMLEWYADQKFVDELRRYLRSSRIQKEDEEG